MISAWEEYSKAGPASDSDVEEAEALLGVIDGRATRLPVQPEYVRHLSVRRKGEDY